MKLIDQNNNPITDPSTLPAVPGSELNCAIGSDAVADATAAVDESYEAARADAGAVAFADASITHGKNDVPEMPAIMGTTSADDVAAERARISAALSAANPSAAFEDDLPTAQAHADNPENTVGGRRRRVVDTSVNLTMSDVDEARVAATDLQHAAEVECDARLCPRDLMVARLRNIKDRLYTYANQSAGRISLVSELLTTAQQLQLAIEMSASLPPDWKPVRTSPTAALAEGVHVFIKSKHRAFYQSDLSADDMDDMVVVRAGEKRLRCHCVATGVSIFIPAGHVEVR